MFSSYSVVSELSKLVKYHDTNVINRYFLYVFIIQCGIRIEYKKCAQLNDCGRKSKTNSQRLDAVLFV